jgi:hypothetical protein
LEWRSVYPWYDFW